MLNRDGGRCTFVSADGVRCEERCSLEIHHKVPFAKEGAHSLQNMTVRCRAHNLYHAVQDYGDHLMGRYLGEGWAEAMPHLSAKEEPVFR